MSAHGPGTSGYSHTQVGWVMYAVLVPVLVLIVVNSDPGAVGVVLAVVAAAFAVFGWLTVSIDVQRVRIRFGIGLVRRTIPIENIRAFAPVRNPWYWGWGIRLTPHGILYNVSGLDAVELLLADGRRVRVGTDEPGALVQAIQRATGLNAATSPADFPNDATWRRRARLITIAIVVLLGVFIVGQMYVYSQEPTVAVSDGAFAVDVGLYGASVPLSQATAIDLVERLPHIEARTNGFAAGGLLRGNFRLAEWGHGQLFVNRNVPPFLVVRTGTSFVVVNFDNPERTRSLHAQLAPRTARPVPR